MSIERVVSAVEEVADEEIVFQAERKIRAIKESRKRLRIEEGNLYFPLVVLFIYYQ